MDDADGHLEHGGPPPRRLGGWALWPALVAAAVASAACSVDGTEESAGPVTQPEVPSTVQVLMLGEAVSGFRGTDVGDYATLDGPNVCLEGEGGSVGTTGEGRDGAVRLTGIELDPPDSGIEITDIGVVAASELTTMAVSRIGRLRKTPQGAQLHPENEVRSRCGDDASGSDLVFVELRKKRAGALLTERSRYVYEAAGRTYRTDWFPLGFSMRGASN